MNLEDRFYTLSEVADITKLTDRTLRNYLANGTLKGQKVGGQWRFSKEDIKALFLNDTFYDDRKGISEKNVNKFINKDLKFESTKSACIIIDINDYSIEERRELHRKIDELGKNDEIIERVTFIDHDGKMRLNIIASLSYIKKILDMIN